MGTRVAPTYANIFMAKLEKIMVGSCPQNLKQFLHCWKRFIDDIFFIWSGSYEDLSKFHEHLNSVHPTMKFDEYEHNEENNSCNFLDIKISITDGVISTDLYRKETDKPSALLPSSAHPGHIAKNIVYSMGFRLLRICSSQERFEYRLKELKNNFLMPRNYKPSLINLEFDRVRGLPGDDFNERRRGALEKVEKEQKNNDRIIAPLDFNPHLPKASEIFRKHHKAMIFNDNVT